MHQEDAIVLGTGGGNSDGSFGALLEGVMTAGYPTTVVPVGYTQESTRFPVVGAAYRITDARSGTVMDAVNGGTAKGTVADLWASLRNLCQQWAGPRPEAAGTRS